MDLADGVSIVLSEAARFWAAASEESAKIAPARIAAPLKETIKVGKVESPRLALYADRNADSKE